MKKDNPKVKKLSELRKRAENKLKPETIPVEKLSDDEVRKLAHELQVHQRELEMQNDELRRAQEKIEASHKKYSNLYDFAPVGYFIISEDDVILEANLTGALMLGIERSLLIKKQLSLFISREDQDKYYLYRRHIFKQKEHKACELKIEKKDGTTFHVQLTSALEYDSEEYLKRCRLIMTDITEQKQIGKKIDEAENFQKKTKTLS